MRTATLRTPSLSCGLWLAASLLIGCAPDHGGTRGLDGRATFFCGPSCRLSDILLAAGGATFRISYQSPVPVASLQSTAPAALTFSALANDEIEIHTGSPGTGELVLQDGRGQTIDRLRLRVEPVTELLLQRATPSEPVILRSGASLHLRILRRGPSGQLAGTPALRATVSGPLRVDFDPSNLFADQFLVTQATGDGSIEFAGSDATLVLPVRVVGDQDLVRLEGQLVKSTTLGGGVVATEVAVRSFTAEGAVYGVPCQWRIPSGVQRVGTGTIRDNLEYPPLLLETFQLLRPGAYDLTCNVGSVAVTLPLDR